MYLLAMLFLVICVKPFITVEVPIVGLMRLLLYLNLIGCVVATARSGNQLFLTGSLAVAAAACQTLWSQNQTGTTLTLFQGSNQRFLNGPPPELIRGDNANGRLRSDWRTNSEESPRPQSRIIQHAVRE